MSHEELNHYFETGWEAVVGANGLGDLWDSEIEDLTDDEGDVDTTSDLERDYDLASLNHLLAMEYTKTN
jgi:hypothetical protein